MGRIGVNYRKSDITHLLWVLGTCARNFRNFYGELIGRNVPKHAQSQPTRGSLNMCFFHPKMLLYVDWMIFLMASSHSYSPPCNFVWFNGQTMRTEPWIAPPQQHLQILHLWDVGRFYVAKLGTYHSESHPDLLEHLPCILRNSDNCLRCWSLGLYLHFLARYLHNNHLHQKRITRAVNFANVWFVHHDITGCTFPTTNYTRMKSKVVIHRHTTTYNVARCFACAAFYVTMVACDCSRTYRARFSISFVTIRPWVAFDISTNH